MRFRFAFIACGNMQSILIRALLDGGTAKPADVCIYEPSDENIAPFLALGVRRSYDYNELIDGADVIFLGVKPQILPAVLDGIRAEEIREDKVFVSIIAGVSAASIQSRLGPHAHVVRVMPNTPMLIGEGAIAIGTCPGVPQEIFDFICKLFSTCGVCRVMEESLLDVATAVNGSGPAYFYRLAGVAARFGREHGMDDEAALALAVQTMLGAARMLQSSDKTPQELCRVVMSPGGTTVAAMDAFTEAGLDEALYEGMEACLRRARELSV